MLNIRNGGHRELEKYYQLMEMGFDSGELISRLNIHKGLMSGSWEFVIIYDEESRMDMAYALVCKENLYGYALLKYFAVLPWYRGQGVGVQSMRLLNKRYADRQGIIAEITEFEDEDKDRVRKLRKFFARFGYVEIESDYRIGGVEAHLMVKPIKGSAEIAPIAHRIMPDFYARCMSDIALYKMISINRVFKA